MVLTTFLSKMVWSLTMGSEAKNLDFMVPKWKIKWGNTAELDNILNWRQVGIFQPSELLSFWLTQLLNSIFLWCQFESWSLSFFAHSVFAVHSLSDLSQMTTCMCSLRSKAFSYSQSFLSLPFWFGTVWCLTKPRFDNRPSIYFFGNRCFERSMLKFSKK